jgi:hypothetical protein
MPFARQELHILLTTRGIGPEVVRRLEEAGLDSLSALKELGVEATVAKVRRRAAARPRLAAVLTARRAPTPGNAQRHQSNSGATRSPLKKAGYRR